MATQRYYADIQKGRIRQQLGNTYESIPIPKARKND
jgi:hypothetical protein